LPAARTRARRVDTRSPISAGSRAPRRRPAPAPSSGYQKSPSTPSGCTLSPRPGEGDGTATITINRTGLTTGSDSVHFASVNGSAIAGSDYTAVNQTVTFAPGETSKTVSVPITNNAIHEANETVQLSLSSPSAGATLGTPSTATLTILDDDNGKIASALLSKTSFKSSEARKVKLTYRFAPRSTGFTYLLSIKNGSKWVIVRSVKRTGSFSGSHKMTVKQLFGSKPVKRGSYRLRLSANVNSKLLGFRVR